uniref:DUF1499 domain-containing protein n=1 Tax=Erythrolobus australicus TaxID=1077150 RepID=A0A7S1XJH7_9RHOD
MVAFIVGVLRGGCADAIAAPRANTSARVATVRMARREEHYGADGSPAPSKPSRRAVIHGAAAALLLSGMTLLDAKDAEASVFHFSGKRPNALLGPKGGDRYLELCPDKPNCISTSSNAYSKQFVPPWTYNPDGATSKKSMKQAVEELTRAIEAYPGAKIVTSRATNSTLGGGWYIASEFESSFMGFVDDVEFLFSPDGKTVDYRSASRIGEDDFKANRTRIKNLRVELQNSGWMSVGF